jgi:GT2 family glycosyltransferase
VLDNASTDGTPELVRERYRDQVELVALPTNEGGAGGFHEGLRLAHAAGHEWIWLMDDDTIANPTALAELLAGSARTGLSHTPAMLSSKIVWTDGAMHPMNSPGFEREASSDVFAAAEQRLMPLRTATFVSLLLHRGAVDRHGLPLKRYFLWSDDIEYTARILGEEPGYLVPASVAVHKTKSPDWAISSGDRFYFLVRNTIYMLRGTAWKGREKPDLFVGYVLNVVRYLHFSRCSRASLAVVGRGVRDGLKPGAPVAARP